MLYNLYDIDNKYWGCFEIIFYSRITGLFRNKINFKTSSISEQLELRKKSLLVKQSYSEITKTFRITSNFKTTTNNK